MCVYVPAYVCVSVRVCLQILSGAPHTWPRELCNILGYLYNSSYSTRAVLRDFFLSPGFTGVEALEALHMLAVNIILLTYHYRLWQVWATGKFT